MKNVEPNGVHYLISFFGCDAKQIDDENFWRKMLDDAVKEANILVLERSFFKFDPQGVTGFLLLEASHVSIHTWPEHGYVACDVFTCAPYSNTQRLTRYIIDNIMHEKISINEIKRGYKFFDVDKYIKDNELSMPIYADGRDMKIAVEDVIEGVKSDYQDILFVSTKEFGKCLVIDGIMQTSESDHEIYDRTILSELNNKDKHIMILGGGDGYVSEKALKINPNLKIDVVDIDAEVVKGCEKHLCQGVFKDPRIRLCIDDVFKYLKNDSCNAPSNLDGIVADLTDEPSRDESISDFKKFYSEVFSLARSVLKDGGWISMQAGASKVTGDHVDAAAILKEVLEECGFKDISRKDVMIPSFGEENAFLFAKK